MEERVRIKICGLTREADIDCANELDLDYIGFVFARKSKRYVSPERAAELRGRLRDRTRAVGVFVREDPEQVAALLRAGIIDLAQFHGGEDREYLSRLRTLTDAPLIQAFRIDRPKDCLAAAASPADHILLDHGAGGTGECFDWSLIRSMSRPYFLAGGLTPENVEEALSRVRPWAVDISSGVERDGRKDPERMRLFVRRVREAEKAGPVAEKG